MSFNLSLESVIESYINSVSSKYNIPKKELMNLWNGSDSAPDPIMPAQTSLVHVPVSTASSAAPAPAPVAPTASPNLDSLKKPELVEMCKKKGLKHTGNKKTLIERLRNPSSSSPASTASSKKGTKKKATNILDALRKQKSTIEITRNEFGEHMHSESRLIFREGVVVGRQDLNGKIHSLTKDDINTCNKYKFSYKEPENLAAPEEEVDEEDEELLVNSDDEAGEDEEEEIIEEEVDESDAEEEEFSEEELLEISDDDLIDEEEIDEED